MIRRWLDSVPCPPWLADALEARARQRLLVLEIWALSDRTTAFLALWLARGGVIASRATPGPNVTVEDGLRGFRALLLAGALRR